MSHFEVDLIAVMTNEKAFYKRYLKEEFSRRCEKNPSYSLRAFARALGLTPSALSEVLSEKRVPSYKMAQKILGSLDVSPTDEKEFLASLASSHKERGMKRLSPVFKSMNAGPQQPPELSIELFRVIGDWYHYAILTLTRVEGFKSEPRWIARQLGINATEAKHALERLIQLELLREVDGKLAPFEEHFTTADKSLTTAALKRHQKQILEKAIHSLENDPIERRSMTSMTMAVDSDRIAEAKRRIETFTNELCQFLEGGSIDPKPSSLSGFAIVHVGNDAARDLYVAMSGVAEEDVPAGTIMKRKVGKNLICFKQLLNSCGYFQCNIAYSDLTTGEILKK